MRWAFEQVWFPMAAHCLALGTPPPAPHIHIPYAGSIRRRGTQDLGDRHQNNPPIPRPTHPSHARQRGALGAWVLRVAWDAWDAWAAWSHRARQVGCVATCICPKKRRQMGELALNDES
ncbi:hypothetical protein F5Y13DRAFT_59687 [Hypoxylon sp. FL1857]|nr:hypothetical protein F5Y13DRAFT_59687 [Hypoxylon sp. FL1857]